MTTIHTFTAGGVNAYLVRTTPDAQASLAKLRPLPITAVYLGHGQLFPITAL